MKFAKYLPVEGEIKEGDKFNSLYGELPGSQHTRLFLCSRDIQVGDKFRKLSNSEIEFTASKVEMGSGENYFPKEMLVWHTEDQLSWWLKLSETFKVIGEISPEATYVKEGDEFDEEEIELWTGFGHFRKIERNNPDYYLHAKEKGSIFKILGPCKHFH